MRGAIACAFTLTLFFASCGGDDDVASAPVTTGTISAACVEAFRTAAQVDPLQDTHEDLFAAFSACSTVDEWRAADALFPSALDAIVDAATYARNMCEGYDEIAGTPMCEAVAGADY